MMLNRTVFTTVLWCLLLAPMIMAQPADAAGPGPVQAADQDQAVPASPNAAAVQTQGAAKPPRARRPSLRTDLEDACRDLGYLPASSSQHLSEDISPSLPAEIPYNRVAGEPQGYVLEERARKGLWIPGVVIGSVFYSISALAALGSTHEEDRILALPVAGPVIRAVREDDPQIRGLLSFDAGAQIAAATLMYLGFTLTRKVWVKQYQFEVGVLPMAGPGARGLNLVGAF